MIGPLLSAQHGAKLHSVIDQFCDKCILEYIWEELRNCCCVNGGE